MPPVGQIFTDEQIAAVLTYMRREWGQGGDAGRTGDGRRGPGRHQGARRGPWTDAELVKEIGDRR